MRQSKGKMARTIKNQVFLGVLAMLCVSIISACFGGIARVLHQDFGVYHQLWIRILLMSCIALLIPLGRKSLTAFKQLSRIQKISLILQGILVYPLGALTWVAAVQVAPLATVAFIVALPTEAVWGWVLFRDKFSLVGLGLVLLAIIGLWLVISPDVNGIGSGVMLALTSSLSFSLGMMLNAKTKAPELTAFQRNIIIGVVGGTLLFALGVLNEPFPKHLDINSAWILILGAVLILLNLNLMSFGFKQLSGSLAGTVLMFEVIASIAVGYFFYGETVAISALYGGSLIVGSTIALSVYEHRSSACRVES